MDEAFLLRRVLINQLIDGGIRFLLLARLAPGGFFGPLYRVLADERGRLVAALLDELPDDDLMQRVQSGVDFSGLEVIEQEVRISVEEGQESAALGAIAAEVRILESLEDIPEAFLPVSLAEQVGNDVRLGIERLRLASDRTVAEEAQIITYSTKGSELRASPQERQRIYEVWFGTNRVPVRDGNKIIGFSAEAATKVTIGLCGVTIPQTHKIGENKPNWWRRYVLGERQFAVSNVDERDEASFWSDIHARLVEDGIGPQDAIVFIHGYNVSFDSAAKSAAQIGADLNHPGVMAFFSWPSFGRTFRYAADEATVEASEFHITKFLEDFATRSGARRIHVIVHSMGNRALLRAANRIATNASLLANKPFGQFILAAPDVDVRTFRMLCAAYPTVSERTTLYVSDKDWAVRSSEIIHSASRVGYVPPVTVVPGIDTVSVSKVDLSLLGHGYVNSCRIVLTDIHQLLTSALEPGARAGMTALITDDGGYWELAS